MHMYVGSGKSKLSQEQIERARELRATGIGWEKLGRLLGCNKDTIRRVLDPAFRMQRMEQVNRARYARNHADISIVPDSAPPAEVIEQREHRVMLRHTSLTALLCGDPLPGESALDQKVNNADNSAQAF